MTPLQIIVVSCLYFVALLIVIYFTRVTAVVICIVAIIGPPRDYLHALKFPSWMVFAPGVAAIVGDAVAYIGIVAIGHAVMRLVAGPAREDRLRNKS